MLRIKHLAIIVLSLCVLISTKPLRAEEESKEFKPDFPENYVSVMKYWMKGELQQTKEEMQRLLDLLPLEDVSKLRDYYDNKAESGESTPGHVPYTYNELSDLMLKVGDAQLGRQMVIEILNVIEEVYKVYEHLPHEEFGLVLGGIAKIESLRKSSVVYTTMGVNFGSFLEDAYSTRLLSYYDIVNFERYHDIRSIGGYEGPQNKEELFDFCRDGYFDYFVLDMLRAEAYSHLGAFEEAEKIYRTKIDGEGWYYWPEVSDSGLHLLIKSYLSDDELKMIKIRLAFNYLAWGDRYFKRSHGLSRTAKQKALDSAKEKYEKALGYFQDTHIARDLDDKKSSLDQAEEDLIRNINKPEFRLEIPSELKRPIQIPQKPSVFSKPFTISVPVPTPIKRQPTTKTQRMVPQKQTWEAIVQQMYRKKEVPQVEEKEQPEFEREYTQIGPERQFENVTVMPAYPMPFVPVENPLIIQIVSHAKMQLLKIEKGLNYLGYTDEYVPDQRYSTLYTHANEHADSTIQAENRYIQFKREAEEQEYQIMQLDQNIQLAAYQEQIARTRQAIAEDRQKQADLRMKAIDERIEAIRSSAGFWGALGSGLSVLAGVFTTSISGAAIQGVGALVVASGVGSTGSWLSGMVGGNLSSKHEIAALECEKRAVAVGKVIAAKEGFIAELETKIVVMQQIFMKQNIDYLASREMNQELYYALAKTLKQIKTKYLELGIRLGFLAERALAFEMGKSDLQFIKFDYEVSPLKGLLAGDFLKQDLQTMEYNRILSLKQRNHVKHVISLRQRYPVEFINFIQTGVMTFATGLYDFDKAYPGTYQRRLKRVEVVIQGAVGPEGFKGNLANFGTFVVRSKYGTLSEEVRRLLPTKEQIQEAYQNLSAKGLSIQEVGGLEAFVLPSQRLMLSRYEIRQDQIIFPTEPEVRELFEGFGVAGLWRLELPKNMNDADYRTIADVKVILYFDALYDPELEAKIGGHYDEDGKWVDGLVKKYEKEVSGGAELDQIASFSLRQHFPDEFFSLTEGKIEFELLDGDFPLYMTNKKVKKVMVLALDRGGKGVQGIGLRITRMADGLRKVTELLLKGPVALSIEAETNADGYAIDHRNHYMDPNKETVIPENERVPIVGFWRIDFPDTTQADKLDDMLVFFMYEYQEKTGRPTIFRPFEVYGPSPKKR